MKIYNLSLTRLQLSYIKSVASDNVSEILSSMAKTDYVDAMENVMKENISFLSSLIASCDECLDTGYNRVVKLNGDE